MSVLVGAFTMSPGVTTKVQLINIPDVVALKVTNGTPFDITYSGFGVIGQSVIPAGTEYLLEGSVQNTGHIDLTPVNNIGITGTGVANVVAYQRNEPLPTGTWPITVPAQVVQAKVSTVTNLVNDGNVAGTQIIESSSAGQTSETSVTNDGLWILKTLVSGTLHQFLKTQNSGNLLQLVQSGDIAEVLGQLVVDQLLTMSSSGLTVPAATDAVYNVPTGQKHNFEVNAASEVTINANSLTSNVGVNTNTIRDNVAGGAQILLSNAAPQVAVQNTMSINGKVTVVNGTTSGTATIYEMIIGTGLKVTMVQFSNFRNGTASTTTTNLLVTWNRLTFFFSGDIGLTSFSNSGTGITVGELTGLSSGSTAGAVTNQTIIGSNQLGSSNSSFAQIQFDASDTLAHNGSLFMIGT